MDVGGIPGTAAPVVQGLAAAVARAYPPPYTADAAIVTVESHQSKGATVQLSPLDDPSLMDTGRMPVLRIQHRQDACATQRYVRRSIGTMFRGVLVGLVVPFSSSLSVAPRGPGFSPLASGLTSGLASGFTAGVGRSLRYPPLVPVPDEPLL